MLATLAQTLPVIAARLRRANTASPFDSAALQPPEWVSNTLVEPVLRAIGWDLEAVDQVSRDVKLKRLDKPVDYVLHVSGEPQLLIEVVPLDTSIDRASWLGRLFRSAELSNIRWVVVSNGDDYQVYRVEDAAAGDHEPFRAVKVSQDEPATVEATVQLFSPKLLELNRIEWVWQMYTHDRKVCNVIEMLFGVDPGFAQLVSERSGGLTVEEVRGSLGRAHVAFDDVAEKPRPDGIESHQRPKDLMTEVELRVATWLQRKALERWSRGRTRAGYRTGSRRSEARRDTSDDRRTGAGDRRVTTVPVKGDRRSLEGERRNGERRRGSERRCSMDRRHATKLL